MLKLEQKEKVFEIICGDWDYRNVDMTEPHLQKIKIVGNKIEISCELFSPSIDDYAFCNGGIIEDKQLVKKFKKLNLSKKQDVLKFISDIDNLIDWKQVETDLYSQVELEKSRLQNIKQEEKFEEEYEDIDSYCDDEVMIVPAKKLGEGWNWHKYDDGSGHLESPEGKEYMSYDLQTNEYRITRDSSYDLFPLSYYYADGVDPSKFKPFEYMENEMIGYVLPREKNNTEISL